MLNYLTHIQLNYLTHIQFIITLCFMPNAIIYADTIKNF